MENDFAVDAAQSVVIELVWLGLWINPQFEAVARNPRCFRTKEGLKKLIYNVVLEEGPMYSGEQKSMLVDSTEATVSMRHQMLDQHAASAWISILRIVWRIQPT